MILRLIKNKHLLGDPRISLFIYSIWVVLLLVSLYFLGVLNDKEFFHFGPSNNDSFLGSSINSWPKVILLYFISFFTAAFNTYYGSVYGTWFYNQVKDTERDYLEVSKKDAKIMTFISPIVTGVNDIVGIFILLTKQFQYIIPQIFGDVIVSVFTAHKYINKKKKFKKTKLEIF